MTLENPDLNNGAVRQQIIEQIESDENYSRKRESQRRFDVFKKLQDRYILEQLEEEFDVKTVKEMRKILSINMTEKIIKELSSIYLKEPDRKFPDANEKEIEQIEAIYKECMVDARLKQSNRYYNLFDQNDIYIVPKNGKLHVRPLTLMSYDVIPDVNDPETAYAYILNSWDEGMHNTYRNSGNINRNRTDYYNRNYANEKIADPDDRLGKAGRYIVWTKDLHFTMDGKGDLIGEIIPNPIGRLPFVNVALEKDGQFFVKRGSDVANFDTEFSVCLSDLANTVKLQSYAQAVVTAETVPQNMKVGPNHILFLQAKKNSPITPKFEFVSPNPDIGSSIQFLEMLLSLMLSSRDIDPKEITGSAESSKFTSGFERLLAMLDKFEASQDDIAIYQWAEREIFEVLRLWSNEWQGVTDDKKLDDRLRIASISDKVTIDVTFNGPEATKTEAEDLDVVERRLDRGLITKKRAIMRLDDVEEDAAEELLNEVKEEEKLEMPEITPIDFINEGDDGTGTEDPKDKDKSEDKLKK